MTPLDLAKVINKYRDDLKDLKVIVEPGRSLVADAGILITHLLGVKVNEARTFLVCDASMCECIRPCLYSAYHHIEYVKALSEEASKESCLVDVVGPVCESGDFLGKDRFMQIPLDEFQRQNCDVNYLAIMVMF